VQARVTLNTGAQMPLLNLGGTAQSVVAGNHYSNYSEFLRQGGRGIDTALTYTDPLNLQIAAALKAHPEIPRSEIFITTKVPCCPGTGWCSKTSKIEHYRYNGTIAADMAQNNKLLSVEYTDLTLLHHPCDSLEDTIEVYVELQEAMKAGHTKAIGVSNFNAAVLTSMAADKRVTVVPAANQCNHAIGNHNESHDKGGGGDDITVDYCKAHGISYSAFSPLEGLSGKDVFKIPAVVAIGKAHKVSAAQVALKWLVQQNISAVTAAHNPAYIAEDIDLWSWGELSAAEMATLAAI
jgi:diketogulonate reductase-like aldo/keto reductase